MNPEQRKNHRGGARVQKPESPRREKETKREKKPGRPRTKKQKILLGLYIALTVVAAIIVAGAIVFGLMSAPPEVALPTPTPRHTTIINEQGEEVEVEIPGLSAGRVQSVATRLIVERERERMAFKRAPYWDIVATLSAPDALGERAEFSARMIALGGKRLAGSKDFGADGQLTPDGFAANVRQLDEAGATAVAEALRTADFTVMSMETKPYRRRATPRRRSPPRPCSRPPAIASAWVLAP